jgi:hypothetical protein
MTFVGETIIADYHRDKYEGVLIQTFGPDEPRCAPFTYPDNYRIRIIRLIDDRNPYNYKFPVDSVMMIHKSRTAALPNHYD